ncbi:hypothetical protein [Ferriphaselus sp. R-1]|uniref:hypothetical protein n=1 Tax=Ferriphaselus sp. R-1 TaxID=1485544 RepID=UPI0005518AC4|nr:hypothetical protein [Ferriphaselus sp. R-1]
MQNFRHFRFAALLGLCLTLPCTTALADADKTEKSEDDPTLAIRGNPPADHPFAKLKRGMKFSEAVEILGKPTSERSFCTGKQHIPFYMGPDKGRTEYFYKGQGKVIFFTQVSVFGMFHVNKCTPKDPFEVAGAEYNPNESGDAPKTDDGAQK